MLILDPLERWLPMSRQADDMVAALESAARDLFSARGYAGTSMRDIAKEAGLSPANIYNYAASKEELLWRVNVKMLSQLVSDAESAVSRSVCPVAQVANVMTSHVRYHAISPRFTRLTKVELAHLIPRHRREISAMRNRYESIFRDAVRRGGDLALLDASLERYAVFSMLEMGYGVGLWYRDNGELTLEQVGTTYSLMALRMLACDWERHAEVCPDQGYVHPVTQADEVASAGG